MTFGIQETTQVYEISYEEQGMAYYMRLNESQQKTQLCHSSIFSNTGEPFNEYL